MKIEEVLILVLTLIGGFLIRFIFWKNVEDAFVAGLICMMLSGLMMYMLSNKQEEVKE